MELIKVFSDGGLPIFKLFRLDDGNITITQEYKNIYTIGNRIEKVRNDVNEFLDEFYKTDEKYLAFKNKTANTYGTETTADIIVEIKQKWSEINVLLNRLESKTK